MYISTSLSSENVHTDSVEQNVLYLMIVNMPSDTELAAARTRMDGSNKVQLDNDISFTTVDI